MAIKISATGVAEFVGSTAAQRRQILRPFLKRDSGEAKGRSHYYRAALNAIRAFHRYENDVGIIDDAIGSLEAKLKSATVKRDIACHKHNVRVLKSYKKHFSARAFRPTSGHRLKLIFADLVITPTPDLWVEEKGKPVLVKLYFSLKKPKTMQIPMLLHLIREGAIQTGYPAEVICLDMNGTVHNCPRDRVKMNKVLATVAAQISAEAGGN